MAYSTLPPAADASVKATKSNARCGTDLPVVVPAKTIITSVGIGEGRPISSITTARRIAEKQCLINEPSTTLSSLFAVSRGTLGSRHQYRDDVEPPEPIYVTFSLQVP